MINENNEVMNPKMAAVAVSNNVKCDNEEQEKCVFRFLENYTDLIDCYGEKRTLNLMLALTYNIIEWQHSASQKHSCKQEDFREEGK